MRNWYLLASICGVSTFSLMVAVMPSLRGSLRETWSSAHANVLVIVVLCAAILAIVVHLTTQQVKITRMRLHVQAMEEEAAEWHKQNAIRLHAQLNVTRLMGAVSDPLKLFQGITSTCIEVFNCHQASLMTVSEDGAHLEMKAASGHLNENKVRDVKHPIGQGIAGYVAQSREPLILGEHVDPADYPGLEIDHRGLFAAMVMPIILRDELVGVLSISSRSEGTVYTDQDLQALEVFAINAGICIHHSERTEWMRQTIEQYSDKERDENVVQKI